MYTLLYRLNDGVVEDIEQHDYEWIIESIFDDKEYKTVNDLPQYNPYRQYLKILNNEIIVENKTLSQKEIVEIEKIEIQNEIENLKKWFNIYYTQHEQKYRRLVALNKLTDYGENPNDKLIELYSSAEVKRRRIQELENSQNFEV